MKSISALAILFLIALTFISSNLFAQSVVSLLDEGDKYYEKFDNQKALDFYTKAEKLDANNIEILWRISRAYVDLAEKMPSSTGKQEDAQLAVFEKAKDYAEKTIKADGSKSIGYLRRAIANGKVALFKGVFSVAGVVNSVKSDCEKSIQLNNGGSEIQAITHYVLARTHAKISEKWAPARSVLGLGWADNEIALKEYKKAIELKPGYIMFYVDYALSLIEEDEDDIAKEMLNKAIKSKIQDEDDDSRLAEAKELLKKL
ncbi:MAG: hypothetical protein M0P71_15185 [Melioribacteraceae bacterium]|nr:hypothetical protein [Melioribacteraceae bacterium]